MTDTPRKLPIEISHGRTGKGIYTSAKANNLGEAVVEACAMGADLTGANLTGANLTGAYMKGADLTGADLTGAYMKGANLTDANLTGAYMKGANMTDANLTDANLTGAYMKGADLTGAYMTEAYMKGADLTGAYMKDADLTGADLTDANLTGAYMKGANLTGAYMRGEGGEKEAIVAIAMVQFTGHGECGRTLTAIKTEKSIRLSCGCFYGGPDDLLAYIASGKKHLAKTRALALDTVLMLLDATNEEAKG
jgi:hypothetical protein